jgi:hypothetical protein
MGRRTSTRFIAGSGAHFSRLSARRLRVLGGIGLILVGMIFGSRRVSDTLPQDRKYLARVGFFIWNGDDHEP